MSEELKAELLTKLAATLTFISKLVTYLSKKENTNSVELSVLEHVMRLLNAYAEYQRRGRPEAYLRAIFEREKKEFFAFRAAPRGGYQTAKSTGSPLQAKIKELFSLTATDQQCEELLQLAGSEEKAIEFLEWRVDPPDEYLKKQTIMSVKYILGSWSMYEKARPDEEELRRLERMAARQNAAMSNVRQNKPGR